MDNFYTIRFKRATAKRFKSFSKKVSNSYSVTMELIIDFFEWHGFLPSERFEKSLGQELVKNRKRTEAAIAIIKDIEKNQTKPTNAMLELLFQESPEQNETQEELFEFEPQELITENEELNYYRNQYQGIQQQYQNIKDDLEKILNKTSYVKGSFGKGYLKLELTMEEFENYKQRLQDVHHNNQTDYRR
ncbi:BfmA/BtgA family mobilization protein [Flavivirga rizhaonensis]|uniref:Uncharacterized protein n=1 Tax=Flavivirga rizhaonensis TaxID=2559571 RepID=A0A4S1E0E7_9FLAO|nr:BfmA/BtgA family mobilization protein [Flavivirga rizhaonensis]TGV03368.1 hypothetical protein EM932_06755 [Flavivirga rizhaonensis]